MNKFTSLFGAKVTLSCFKQFPLNSSGLILELFIHTSFGVRPLFAAKEGSFDNPLDSHSATVFGRPEKVIVL